MNRRDFLLSLSLLFLSACGKVGTVGGTASGALVAPIAPRSFMQSTPSNPLIFVGDSITAYWPLANYWANTINAGIAGQDTAAILARMDGLLSTYPQAACFIILAGDNDSLLNNYAVAVQNILLMAQKCISAKVPFILCQVPARAWSMAALNVALITMCMNNGFAHPVDYFSATSIAYDTQNTAMFVDSTHPNTLGYNAMAAVLQPVLTNKLAGYAVGKQIAAIL